MKRLAAAWMAVLTAAAPVASACGFHGQLPDLVAAHPRSIDVALAVRDALDAAALRPLPDAPGVLGLVRANRMLQQLSPMLPAAIGDAPAAPSVAVLLVESGLWTRFTASGDGTRVEPHVQGPRPGEVVLVTSETALAAVVTGRIDPAVARSLGLLVTDRAA